MFREDCPRCTCDDCGGKGALFIDGDPPLRGWVPCHCPHHNHEETPHVEAPSTARA